MGLTITLFDGQTLLGEVSRSASGFHAFRNQLAKAAGIRLGTMDRFGGSHSWDEIQDDIAPLLDRSDRKGELSPAECARVAPRLRELVEAWPDQSDEEEFDRNYGLSLSDLVCWAAERGLPLVFN